MGWIVRTTRRADKQIEKLPADVRAAYSFLAKELELDGPYRVNWKHFGKLRGSSAAYHCHFSSGRPTYVACWEVKDKRIHVLEVYYVGTHENAPY